jgi:DNA repair protein RadC
VNYRSIKNWPEDERPRERLLASGAQGLSTAELFAIVLRTGGRDKSALELAREVLMRFPSLKEIEDAAVAEFADVKGMGKAKIAQVKASIEIGKRLFRHSNSGRNRRQTSFRNSRDVFDYFMPRFYGLKKEKFLCALLDVKNRVFKETVVSEGTLTSSPVHPREVFREAIKEAAASVLFVHNHPSGDPNPSSDDIHITKRLVETGKVVGIAVLDHIVISDGKFLSMMEKGYI